VGQWGNGSSNNQRWTISDVGGGYFKLRNVATGLCLDVGASPWANGDPVEQWPDGSSQNMHWQFVLP
ncbi:MAG TPA: RICIN domain-containing protein, partial [Opitutus sp.]|nr:RICIN domain-containing protein [Opitutus sp.]